MREILETIDICQDKLITCLGDSSFPKAKVQREIEWKERV